MTPVRAPLTYIENEEQYIPSQVQKPSVLMDNQQCHKTLPSYHFSDFHVFILTLFLVSCLFNTKQSSRKRSSILLFVEHKYILNVVVTLYFCITVFNSCIAVGHVWYAKQHFHIKKKKWKKTTKNMSEKKDLFERFQF